MHAQMAPVTWLAFEHNLSHSVRLSMSCCKPEHGHFQKTMSLALHALLCTDFPD